MLSAPRPQLPPLPAAAPQLRIYIYDLPPQFNSWLAAHFRRPGRWDQSYLYSLDAKLHRWLLRSPYRTLDPAQADYFLVPAYPSTPRPKPQPQPQPQDANRNPNPNPKTPTLTPTPNPNPDSKPPPEPSPGARLPLARLL